MKSGFRNQGNFACEIWNPRLCIPEYSSENPFESRIQVSLTKNPESKTALDSLIHGAKKQTFQIRGMSFTEVGIV